MARSIISFFVIGFLIVLSFTLIIDYLITTTSFTNQPPYISYTNTAYTNTSGVIGNTTQNATILRTISEAKASNIAKTETLLVYVTNAGNVNGSTIISRVYFNGAYKGNITAPTNAVNSSTFSVVCSNGLNTIAVGSYTAGNNVTFTNNTLTCATHLNGTSYYWMITILIIAMTFITILYFYHFVFRR